METFVLVMAVIFLIIYATWLDIGLANAKHRIDILTSDNAYLDKKCGKLNRQVDDLYAVIIGSAKP